MIEIGITERGDSGIDFTWTRKIDTVDGVILITKNITPKFTDEVLSAFHKGCNIIVHATCTGWGGSIIEPNVPVYTKQLEAVKALIARGFPAKNIVIRIDPIFPSVKGMKRVEEVMSAIPQDVTRIRISILDEYYHVKARLKANGLEPMYGDRFGPDTQQIKLVADTLKKYPQYTFETCAEDKLSQFMDNVKATGCISQDDLIIMGFSTEDIKNFSTNPQGRHGCHCLSCKKELLENKKRCPHKCLYCYWKD